MESVVRFETKAEKVSSAFPPSGCQTRKQNHQVQVRVVFNGSKETGSEFSLNDMLYQGPTLQADLMQLVLRRRNYRYVFTGGMQKLYRQILIHEADGSYKQILFRDKANRHVNSFQLKTVIGVNCAPFLRSGLYLS